MSRLFKGAALLSSVAVMVLLSATPASAQIEGSIIFGYTLSEGVNASSAQIINGATYNSLDVTSGGSWGFTIGGYVTPQAEIEFLFDQQFSTLQASSPAPALKLSDMSVYNYHGVFSYNWGDKDTKVRPFIFGGIGATHYSPGTLNSAIPLPPVPPVGVTGNQINSATKFSFTWGGGVKVYASEHVGLKVQARWTPTYIKTDAAGTWCDPWYGCWVVGSTDYSNQFEMSGGIVFRFDDNDQ